MSPWSKDELRKIGEAEELQIVPFREDGVTYRTPIPIWSVAVGDALYVRAYKGPDSHWHRAAVKQKAGRIIAAGMTKDVTFEPVDGPVNALVDDAYRTKYRSSAYVGSMVVAPARFTTVKILPRNTARAEAKERTR